MKTEETRERVRLEALYAYLSAVRHEQSTDESRDLVEGFREILDRHADELDEAALLAAANAARDEPMGRESWAEIARDALYRVEVLYSHLLNVTSDDPGQDVHDGVKALLDRYEAQGDDAALLASANAARAPMVRDCLRAIAEDASDEDRSTDPTSGGCGKWFDGRWFDIDPYAPATGLYEDEDGVRYRVTLASWDHLWRYLEVIGSTRLRRVTTVDASGRSTYGDRMREKLRLREMEGEDDGDIG